MRVQALLREREYFQRWSDTALWDREVPSAIAEALLAQG